MGRCRPIAAENREIKPGVETGNNTYTEGNEKKKERGREGKRATIHVLGAAWTIGVVRESFYALLIFKIYGLRSAREEKKRGMGKKKIINAAENIFWLRVPYFVEPRSRIFASL